MSAEAVLSIVAASLRCEDEHASKEGCRRRKSSIDWENCRLAVKLAAFAGLVSPVVFTLPLNLHCMT